MSPLVRVISDANGFQHRSYHLLNYADVQIHLQHNNCHLQIARVDAALGVRMCPMKGAVQVLNLMFSGLSLSPCSKSVLPQTEFYPTNHYDVISYVNNTLQTREGIMNATLKLLRAELIAKGR